MRFSILLFIFLVGCVAFSRVSADLNPGEASYDSALNVNVTFAAKMGVMPPRPVGPVTVTMTCAYSVEVCLQESVMITGDLSSCNPGGYLLFESGNSSSAQNFFSLDEDSVSSLFGATYETNFVGDEVRSQTLTANLRGNSVYYLAVRLVGSGPSNGTADFDVRVNWNSTGCLGDNQIGVGSDCVDAPPAALTTSLVNQTLKANASQYFTIQLKNDSNQYLRTTVTVTSSAMGLPRATNNASVSVELRREAAPTDTLADATSYSPSANSFVVELDSPVPSAIYYARVVNDGTTDIVYNIESVAPACSAGLFGANCTANTTDLTNNPNATKVIGTGDYQFYYIRKALLVVGVGTEKLENPAPTLLASLTNYPSNGSALLGSAVLNKTVNFISANNPSFNGSEHDQWYVSVWANPGDEYYIWANIPCANDCTGSTPGNTTHGTCNVDTGTCNCNKGYGNLFCEKTGLALVWIIIIVIVCAIILAIAIGVPVACFLRNRRRARYERV